MNGRWRLRCASGAVRGSQQDRSNQRYDDARGVYCYPEGDCYYPDGRRYR